MRKKLILMLLAFACLQNVATAQKVLVNKKYKAAPKELKVVLAPYFSNGAQEANDNLFLAFNQGKFSIADTSQIIHNIQNDETFYKTLEKTTYLQFDESQLKASPNLYARLTEEEISNFKKNTLGADILIVGSSIAQRKVTEVKGSGFFRLTGNIVAFDLKTGDFILQCANTVKLNHDNITPESRSPVKELFESLYDSFALNLK